MKKYWQLFRIGWQTALEYRLSFFFNILRSSVIPLLMVFFWLALYQGRSQIGDFDLTAMISYYLGVLLLYSNNSGFAAEIISRDIKQGELTNYLLKPISYFKTIFFILLPEDLFNLILRLIICFLVYLFLPIRLNQLKFSQLIIFFIFLLAGYLINFVLNLLLALSAFAMTENFTLRLSFFYLMRFFNGFMFPLVFFPIWAQKIINLSPFAYQFNVPLMIFLGKLSWWQIINHVVIVLVLFLIMTFLLKFLWKRSLQSYEAVGR